MIESNASLNSLPLKTGTILEITDPVGGHFGYITDDESGERLFFHGEDCFPSKIGTKRWPVGTSVSFNIAPENFRRKDIQTREAIRIRNIDAWNTDAYAKDHVEDSQVDVLHDGLRGLWGFLLRQNGERLHFSDGARGFISTGTETLHLGSWVRHKVRSRKMPDGTLRFFAIDMQIFEEPSEPESVHFAEGSIESLWLSESEAENVSEPTPQPSPVESAIYSASERKLTLQQLIQLRKQKAA